MRFGPYFRYGLSFYKNYSFFVLLRQHPLVPARCTSTLSCRGSLENVLVPLAGTRNPLPSAVCRSTSNKERFSYELTRMTYLVGYICMWVTYTDVVVQGGGKPHPYHTRPS